jgi:hypothetical protein
MTFIHGNEAQNGIESGIFSIVPLDTMSTEIIVRISVGGKEMEIDIAFLYDIIRRLDGSGPFLLGGRDEFTHWYQTTPSERHATCY